MCASPYKLIVNDHRLLHVPAEVKAPCGQSGALAKLRPYFGLPDKLKQGNGQSTGVHRFLEQAIILFWQAAQEVGPATFLPRSKTE